MFRVKIDALILKAAKYWYGDTLFSGVGYNILPNGRVKAVQIIDGDLKGDYKSPFFSANGSFIEMDISGFTEDDIDGYANDEVGNEIGLSYSYVGMRSQLLLNEKAYTGLAYEFDGVFCVRELGYRDGFIISDAAWDRSGVLRNLSSENDIDQSYSWYPDGVLKNAQVSISEASPSRGMVTKLRIGLRFTNATTLSSVSLEGEIVGLEAAISTATHFPIKEIQELKNYKAAETFNFFGDAIEYEVFAMMVEQGMFLNTVEILLPSKFLCHEESIDLLASMRELRKVSFYSVNESEVEIAKKIKYKRPDVQVKVERLLPDKPGVYDFFEIGAD